MDRQYDMRRPQGAAWSPVTPSTPSFSPSKFTPSSQQAAWKPFQASERNDNQDGNVIAGSIKVDPSGGYVHTFGAPKKESSPQNISGNQTWQNAQNPSQFRQEPPVTSPPRYCQEIIVPTGGVTTQYRSPVRQTSFQNNPSQFSPVHHTSQTSGPGTPVSYQTQNNGYNVNENGNQRVGFQPTKQTPSPYRATRQDSLPYQIVRQDSVPYQTQKQTSNSFQPSSYNSPVVRQDSMTYPPSRQDSWNPPAKQDSDLYSPSRQESWSNQSPQHNFNTYEPQRQDSYSSKPVIQDSIYSPTSNQDLWSDQSARQASSPYQSPRQASSPYHSPRQSSSPYQSPGQEHAPGLFAKQNSSSPSPLEPIIRYEPVIQNSSPGFQRQSSIQYQASPKPYSPTDYSPTENKPTESKILNNANSPYTYGAPGPFIRQQSSAGPPLQSPGAVESFPTPPPFSPSMENAVAPWPSSSELPTPPPPPPLPPQPQMVPSPAAMLPPPPPPPPPPMPSSTGTSQEVPAWKKQIQATKEAKAAAGIPAQTPGTPSGAPELPAALAGSMKKDKKPFTYLPGGLDLSEIRSPKMQRRIMANQQQAPPPPSCTGQQVLIQPRQNGGAPQPQQIQNQFDRLNLGDGQRGDRMATTAEAQQRPSVDEQDPKTYGQSRSFRILQMMTGGDDETDSAQPQASPAKKEEEMRFTGLRRPDNPIPSRAFHALQKMTSGGDETTAPVDQRFASEPAENPQAEDGPVDIRYKGGYIPGRSFKMLQEMTGMNEDGVSGGTVVPSVLQEKRQQRKPPPHLHLSINQPPPPKQFPQPSVPASQQASDEVPKMYKGGRIPSQSFRMLQAMTGENVDPQGEDGTDM